MQSLTDQEIQYLYEVLTEDHYYCSNMLTSSAKAKHVALLQKILVHIKDNKKGESNA
jgi:hypothetical protein